MLGAKTIEQPVSLLADHDTSEVDQQGTCYCRRLGDTQEAPVTGPYPENSATEDSHTSLQLEAWHAGATVVSCVKALSNPVLLLVQAMKKALGKRGSQCVDLFFQISRLEFVRASRPSCFENLQEALGAVISLDAVAVHKAVNRSER